MKATLKFDAAIFFGLNPRPPRWLFPERECELSFLPPRGLEFVYTMPRDQSLRLKTHEVTVVNDTLRVVCERATLRYDPRFICEHLSQDLLHLARGGWKFNARKLQPYFAPGVATLLRSNGVLGPDEASP